MKIDILKRLPEVDGLLSRTTNPHHRAILQNYKRHSILEVTGHWEGIFDPRMTVEHPVYRFHTRDGVKTYDGANAVKALYKDMADNDSNVIYHTDGHIAVGDDGFYTEYKSHKFVRGHYLRTTKGVDVPDGWFVASQTMMMYWPYDARCRMVEERVVYGADLEIRPCPSEDLVTLEEARAKLLPLLVPIEEFLPRDAELVA